MKSTPKGGLKDPETVRRQRVGADACIGDSVLFAERANELVLYGSLSSYAMKTKRKRV